ncbi:hypothetical protein HMPREF0072_1548 [Anaerococcus lactolyticus ATCC 51172]|uniref:Lipoprotein n=1 Tax=Anaerococcus lactolyticus ATCC 51172 TaxID=525254 RepID=C2BGS8_9FIRM|nr:hypothetical protein [Anaerococcus lactolyticus]EEI85924.1 hypothetical protein HMPREF0072_1548 [Anaerococcus lactolyticus ATCC 51172]
MKITNKQIIAAILIAATLTGCDSLKNKLKNSDDTKVEESTNEETTKKEGAEDAENTGSTEKEDKKDDSEDKSSEDKSSEDKSSEAETEDGNTVVEQLEDAVFNNRVQARAAEILLEETPESLSEEYKAKLKELVEKSNDIIERSEKALEAYKK